MGNFVPQIKIRGNVLPLCSFCNSAFVHFLLLWFWYAPMPSLAMERGVLRYRNTLYTYSICRCLRDPWICDRMTRAGASCRTELRLILAKIVFNGLLFECKRKAYVFLRIFSFLWYCDNVEFILVYLF